MHPPERRLGGRRPGQGRAPGQEPPPPPPRDASGPRRRVRPRHGRRPRGRAARGAGARRELRPGGGGVGRRGGAPERSPTPAPASTPPSPPGADAASAAGAGRVAVVLGDHPALRPRGGAPRARGGGTASVVRRPGRRRRRHRAAHPPGARGAPHRVRRGQRRRPRTARVTCGSTSTCRGCASTSTTRRPSRPPWGSGWGRTAPRRSRALRFPVCRRPSTASRPTAPGRRCSTTASRSSCPAGAAIASGLRHLRVGQRVSVELDEAGRAATRRLGRRHRAGRDHPLTAGRPAVTRAWPRRRARRASPRTARSRGR